MERLCSIGCLKGYPFQDPKVSENEAQKISPISIALVV